MNAISKSTLCLSLGAVMFLAAGGPAAAETMRTEGLPPFDPLLAWAEQLLPRNQFELNSDQNMELIRFTTPRDVEVCVKRSDPDDVDGRVKAVPVTVTWDNQVGTVTPGNCLSFDAKSVKVRPAGELSQDESLLGTFRVAHH